MGDLSLECLIGPSEYADGHFIYCTWPEVRLPHEPDLSFPLAVQKDPHCNSIDEGIPRPL